MKRINSDSSIKFRSLVEIMKPLGYFDYIKLQMNAYCVLSDSGTISEEAAILSFPAITIRNATERPEAIDAGNIVLTGLEPDVILRSIKLVAENREKLSNATIPHEYLIENTSMRVLKIITGTAKLLPLWNGIIKNSDI